MDGILTKLHKQIVAQKQKTDKKNGCDDSEIAILQAAVDEMEIQAKTLETEIDKEEGTYRAVAESKVERKLKSGVSEKKLAQHQAQIDKTNQDLKDDLDSIETKIEKIQANMEAEVSLYDSKIEKLEKQKEAYIQKARGNILDLESSVPRKKKEAKATLAYYQPLVDRCYEDVPLDVIFPPSHYKRKETLKNIQRTIESTKKNILMMKAAEFEHFSKFSKAEEKLNKLREASIREFNRNEQETREREEFEREEAIKVIEQEREARERADDARREADREYQRMVLENLKADGESED